jgi:hypothetical protein
MGFFDSIKSTAGALAADAERAGRVTAAQARLVVLQSDLKKAERELGRAALSLIERGDLDHPELAQAVERVRATSADVRAKEREIAELRGETPPASPEAAPPAAASAEAAPPAPASAADKQGAKVEVEPVGTSAPQAPSATVQTAGGPVTIQPAAIVAAAVAEASFEPEPAASPAPRRTRRKATPRPATTSGKTPAKQDAPQKPRPKKTPAGKQTKAGATPKKASRPSTSRPRPAGKKRPGGA